MTSHDPADEVRLTAMIDDLGSAAADRAIYSPIRIEREQVRGAVIVAPLRLAPVDPLTGIFDDLAVTWNTLRRVDSKAMNPGLSDDEAETGVARVDAWCSQSLLLYSQLSVALPITYIM